MVAAFNGGVVTAEMSHVPHSSTSMTLRVGGGSGVASTGYIFSLESEWTEATTLSYSELSLVVGGVPVLAPHRLGLRPLFLGRGAGMESPPVGAEEELQGIWRDLMGVGGRGASMAVLPL